MTTINSVNFSVGLSSSLDHRQDHDVNAKLTPFSDEEPGCGTVPPGYHGPRPHGLDLSSIPSALDQFALNSHVDLNSQPESSHGIIIIGG